MKTFLKFKSKTAMVMVFIPIAVYLFFSFYYSQNIPYNDDYYTILTFLNKYNNAHSFTQKLHLLFEPYGEHRIFFVRLISLIQFKLFGILHFPSLAFIGNLGLVCFGLLLTLVSYKFFTKNEWFIIPITFFLFQLQAWSNVIWAMASLENILVFFWAGLSLYYFFKQENEAKFLLPATLFGIFATYTNGNGIFVFAIAGFVFLLNKKYAWAIIFICLFLLIFKLNSASANAGIIDNFKEQGIVKIIQLTFTFLGSNFYHPHYIFIATLTGIGFTAYFLYLFFIKKYYSTNPFIFSLIGFVFITALGVAIQRTMFDVTTIAPSRYRIYGSLLLAVTFISAVEIGLIKSNFLKIGVTAFSVLLFAASVAASKTKMENRVALNKSYSFLLQNNIPVYKSLDSIYRFSVAKKYFMETKIPVIAFANDEITKHYNLIATSAQNMFGIDTVFSINNYYCIKGWAGKNDDNNTLNKVVIAVENKKTKSVKTYQSNFIEVLPFINDKNNLKYATSGFVAVFPKQPDSCTATIAISRDVFLKSIEPITIVALP